MVEFNHKNPTELNLQIVVNDLTKIKGLIKSNKPIEF